MTPDEERDDKDVLAAEYALGTLDTGERAQAQALVVVDKSFADLVRIWERRLGELNVLVAPVEPPAGTWERIKAAIATPAPSAGPQRSPEVRPPVIEPPTPEAPRTDILALRRRMHRWRRATVMVTGIAALFAGFVVLREIKPEVLPAQVRPKTKVVEVTKTIEVPSPKPAQYVAVLQKDATSPAFLLTFDLEKKLVTVRNVAADKQSGKQYELWLISNKFPGPRSLGVIANEEFSLQPRLASYDAATINTAVYAVSIEPVGGSTTGAPTGPVVYTGKLIQTTPLGFGGQSP
jgi:anti-sigma-K factor RskA